MAGKKKLIYISLCAMLVFGLFFSLTLLAAVAAILGYQDNRSAVGAAELDAPIACTITGTRVEDALKLKLTYDGMSVSGITGTVSGGSFSASKKSGGGKTKMNLPTNKNAKLDVKTFMCYTAVTITGSDQYKLLNSDGAKDEGIYRKVNGKYAIALGSFYGSKIGTNYTVKFRQKDGTTKTIQAILGDQKADKHTDANHQYHAVDGSVVEFITAKGTSKNVSSTQNQINKDFGTVTGIYRGGGSEITLKGTIKKKTVSVEGTVDGTPLSASGTIENGKIKAEGFIGENAESEGGGVYTGGKFLWPVPGHTRLSCNYGPRICLFHGPEIHSGIDIPAPFGTKVLAAAAGTVVKSGDGGSYGNYIIISHGSGLYTLYGHNSSLAVPEGKKVKAGDVVAFVGSTGSSTGNHCHFEVRKGANSHDNHVSPWNYLKKQQRTDVQK